MNHRVLLGVVCLVVVYGGLAHAIDVRLPANGRPALMFQAPDGWIVGEEKSGGIRGVVNRIPATVALSIVLAKDARDPDRFLAEEMQGAGGVVPSRIGDVEIAGYKGSLYESAGRSQSGTPLSVKYMIARVRPAHILGVTQITSADSSEADRKLAAALIASMTVRP